MKATCATLLTGLATVVAGTLNIPLIHAAEFASRVQVVRAPGISRVVTARTSADDVIHLAFDAEDGPRYVSSRDGGATFSVPIAIVDAAARQPGLKFSVWDMAVGPDGRVHVAMGNNAWKLKLPKEEWGFYYARLAPGAKAFSPVRNINRTPSEGFSLAAGKGGSVTACFLSGKLFAMNSLDGGEAFGASAEVNPEWNPCDCCTTAATYGRDGRLAFLYREETDNERDLYAVLWDQRRNAKPMRTRISSTPWKVNACPMTYFAITPTETGYVAAWPTKGQIYFARLDNDGRVLPPGEIRTPGTSGMRTGVLALGAPDGATLIAWKNKDTLGWQLYDDKGQPQGAGGSEPSLGAGAAGIVLKDGRFLLFP